MKKTNVLILGSGGREYTLAWKIKQSQFCNNLFTAPGNAGTSEFGVNIDLNILDFELIKNLVLKENIDLVVVGPEEPLVKGIHDYFLADPEIAHIKVIGPDKAGAALEGSKDFAKNFMIKNSIPTAKFETFTRDTIEEGVAFLRRIKPPFVLKADGLAAGKGVVILSEIREAEIELREMLLNQKFGEASSKVVIEEFLDGIELSVFVLLDGKNYLILPEAKDYKRIGEGDTGLNTGGMGSISPVPFADLSFMKKVEDQIIKPSVKGLIDEGITYKGFLFIGLMNVNGNPYVIEYNVRLGDPETEVVLPRISNDILELLIAASDGCLDRQTIETDPRTAACVMMVSAGYPGSYIKGKPIEVKKSSTAMLIHAGTTFNTSLGKAVTSGGRVIAIMEFGDNLEDALANVYRSMDCASYEGAYFRRDIGNDLASFKPMNTSGC
ncbi:MAG: phosphoribosylamine--glycine ligase [Bacteroidales bacterium]|nr:phosphoribosylamine--glycine ligase [Bacteroidales bacterium]